MNGVLGDSTRTDVHQAGIDGYARGLIAVQKSSWNLDPGGAARITQLWYPRAHIEAWELRVESG